MRATNGRHRTSNGLPYTRLLAAFMLATLISTIFALPAFAAARAVVTIRRSSAGGACRTGRAPTTSRSAITDGTWTTVTDVVFTDTVADGGITTAAHSVPRVRLRLSHRGSRDDVYDCTASRTCGQRCRDLQCDGTGGRRRPMTTRVRSRPSTPTTRHRRMTRLRRVTTGRERRSHDHEDARAAVGEPGSDVHLHDHRERTTARALRPVSRSPTRSHRRHVRSAHVCPMRSSTPAPARPRHHFRVRLGGRSPSGTDGDHHDHATLALIADHRSREQHGDRHVDIARRRPRRTRPPTV